ncbi:MAG: hypothetical protein IRZ31_16370 [Thermogemmatispora sp.]|nr:hypothetical protein [Thermogemmatispora sp.]
MHAHVLQDVIKRVSKAFQAFFRRVKASEKAGYPRCQGRDRYHSITYREYGNGVRLDGGILFLLLLSVSIVLWRAHPRR